MARISTYETDNDISNLDLLVGSERYIDSGVVKFRTKNYKIGDLATFFGISVGAVDTFLGTFNQDGSFSYSNAFATQVTTTTSGQGFAAATDVTALTATVTNNKNSADASFTSVNSSIATETSARTSAVNTLTSSVNLKPNIFRQSSVPTAEAPKDIWFNTGDGNRMYVATAAGDDQITSGEWEETTDTRLAAVVTSAATATTNIGTLTTADLAKAAQITKLNAEFVLDGSGNITGIDPSKTISSATNTAKNTAISTANKASATRENNLTANVNKVFKQTSEPTVTAASSGSTTLNGAHTNTTTLAHHSITGTREVGQTVTGTGISGDVVIIELTDSNNIVISSPQTLSSGVTLNFAKPQTPPINSLWYDTTNVTKTVTNPETGANTDTTVPKNELYVLTSSGWVANPDALLATQASVNTTASATAGINGKLSARYGIKVSTGNVFAGMELMSNSDATGAVSDIIFTATNFKIKTIDSGGNVSPIAPFIVSGANGSNVVSINGTLKIGGGTSLSDIETKANSATQASDHAAIQAGTTAANVGLANVVNSNFDANGNVIGGAVGGTTINSTKIFQGTGTFGNTNTGFYLDNGGNFSLRDKLVFDGTNGNLSVSGAITCTSISFAAGVTVPNGNVDGLGSFATKSSLAYSEVTGLPTLGTLSGLNTITATHIDNNAITTPKINAGAIDAGKIAANAITAGKIAANAITADKISANAITAAKINANEIDASKISSLSFSGKTATFDQGTIGGWTIGSDTLTSVNDKVTLKSSDTNLTSVYSLNSGTSGSYAGSTAYTSSTLSTNQFGSGAILSSNHYIGLNSGSVDTSSSTTTANSWGGVFSFSNISFSGNSNNAGKAVTVTADLSNSSAGYLAKIVTSGSTNTYDFSGALTCKLVIQIFRANVGAIAEASKIYGGAVAEEDSSGNITLGINGTFEISVTLSSTLLVNGGTYYVRIGLQYVNFIGTFGTSSITGYQVKFASPAASNAKVLFAVGRSEFFGGGLQVIKGSDAFLSLNRSNNTETDPFILSRGFSKHQGDFFVEGSLDASTKNFKIKHPLPSKKQTHYLLHSSVESPRADLIYRGKVQIFSKDTIVNIDEESNMTDGTFNLLCRNVQCFTTNETGWGAVKASVKGNILTITVKDFQTPDIISWMVIGERNDASIYMSANTDDNGQLIVEVEK